MADIISPYNWNIPVEYKDDWYADFVNLIQAIATSMSVIYSGTWGLCVKVSSDPDTTLWGATEASRIWFNTTDKKFKGWNGEEIILIDVAVGKTGEFGLTYAASATIDWDNGSFQYVVLTGNTVFAFSNPTNGWTYGIRITQDAVGGRTVTWPTIKWAGGSSPILTSTATKSDIVTLIYSNGEYYADRVKNF